MSKKTKKLGTDKNYKRPKVTYQEKLTKEEIKEKLEGYVKVTDLKEVPLNTHMRYFIIQDDGKKLFRTGGFLINKIDYKKYVIISNGGFSWSVQVKNTIFFRKMDHQEEIEHIHKMYEQKLKEKDKEIKKLKAYIKKKLK